jgi:hypothetical protein
VNPNDPPSDTKLPEEIDEAINLGAFEVDSTELENPPSLEVMGVYEEQKRQAREAFNICRIFAYFGVLQGVAGVVSVFCSHALGIPPAATGALLGAGGLFGALSNWAYRLSENANARLERIASDEKTRDLIRRISDPGQRHLEISKFLKAILATRSK